MGHVGIVGAGNMGESILKALLKKGIDKSSISFAEAKKERAQFIAKTYGISQVKKVADLAKGSDYVIIAVKPQDATKILPEIASTIKDDAILISIMAGTTLSKIMSLTGRPTRLVRMMPNIAIKVNQGVIGITATPDVELRELSDIKKLFSDAGLIVDIDEDHMDAITSLGASSPAFFLMFLEAMIDGGVKIGISRDKATAISLEVIKGAVAMLEHERMHPALMREMITSPGGTTIAGLASLEEKAFRGSVMDAIEKAFLRARELST